MEDENQQRENSYFDCQEGCDKSSLKCDNLLRHLLIGNHHVTPQRVAFLAAIVKLLSMEDRSSAAITATIAIGNDDYTNNKTLLEMETLVNSTPIIISSIVTTITPNNAQSFNYLSLVRILVLMIGFGVLIICMIFGNLLVIVSIVMERDLRRTQYYLILSLAVADLLVGLLVSPFAAVYDIQEEWNLGVMMCEFWTSMDVLACTSSILHLVAIALDRLKTLLMIKICNVSPSVRQLDN
uniref:G-protein coupled receptors family 1 profile domain-containing protein n=1 Tax=Romanomermis culicivorax TaxID=13658 RepID=A0A915IRC1_ROMCU